MSFLASTAPLEDELGDVLEKGLHFAGLTSDAVAARSGIPAGKLRDALDYRYDLTGPELARLAAVLKLNEVGLAALAQGAYPLPKVGALPFCLQVLSMPHGIGCANAYLVGEAGSSSAMLFDAGPDLRRMQEVWPRRCTRVSAVFLTHAETEHAGGLREIARQYAVETVFSPEALPVAGNEVVGDGREWECGELRVRAISTPGHAKAHFCYFVQSRGARQGQAVVICGDLIFAGSIGGGYFCWKTLRASARRLVDSLPANTVIAPGHGPLTTIANELKYNPFLG